MGTREQGCTLLLVWSVEPIHTQKRVFLDCDVFCTNQHICRLRTLESKTSLDVQRLKLMKEREVSEDYQSFVSEGFIFSFQF